MLWGVSFPVIKAGVEALDPNLYVCYRFLAGALAMGLLMRPRIDRHCFKAGVACGLLLSVGTLTQTKALALTSASNAGFITGLAMVVVPLGQAAIARAWPRPRVWASMALALSGLAILTWHTPFVLNVGDAWALACAVAFGFHLLALGRFAPKADAVALTVVQLGVTGVVGGLVALALGVPFVVPAGATVWQSLAFTTFICTALCFYLMTFAQRFIPPHTVALVFLLEPVFAALASAWLLHEAISWRSVAGGGLIVGAMAVAEE
jgi:drug/metabolite transporter (DMT)-like permease